MNQHLDWKNCRHPSSTRILILGAGPAGLSAAMFLKEKGYQNVTIFEKSPHLGGKCRSLIYKGKTYDIGANVTTPRYTLIRSLTRKFGLRLEPIPPRRMVSLDPNQKPINLKMNPIKAFFMKGILAYYVYMRKRTGVDQDGYAYLKKGASLPFGGWLKRYGLSRLQKPFANLFVAYGYGKLNHLPAVYAMKFFDKTHVNIAIDTLCGKRCHPSKEFIGGFQELWERVARHYGLNVQTEVDTQLIERTPSRIRVEYRQNTKNKKGDFDILILACPFESTLSFLDASPKEKNLFEKIEYNDYYVTTATLKDVREIATFVQPYSIVLTPGFPTVFYPPRKHDQNHVFNFYSYGSKKTSVSEVEEHVRDLVEGPVIKGKVQKILSTKYWRYFPHVSSRVMQSGFYEDFESMQGIHNTYYVGETLSFTLVELVARYSKQLVESYF